MKIQTWRASVLVASLAAGAWSTCYITEPGPEDCGTADQSTATFDCGPIQDHSVWIVFPVNILKCSTNFVGWGQEDCINNSIDIRPVKRTYYCGVGGVIQWTDEFVLPVCKSAGISGDPCEREEPGGGGDPGN